MLNSIPALNVSSTKNILMKANVYKGKPSFGKYIIAKNVQGLTADIPN